MAQFPRDPDKTNDPTYTGSSQGTSQSHVNQQYASLFSGGAQVLETGLKAADTTLQLGVKERVREGVERIQNEEFGVREATEMAAGKKPPTGALGDTANPLAILGEPPAVNAVRMGAGKGAPAGVAKLGNTIESLDQAYRAGMLSNSYYTARLNSLVKEVRAQYGGAYDDQIDAEIHARTGIVPANALRAALLADMDSKYRSVASQSNKDVSYLEHNQKYLGELAPFAVAMYQQNPAVMGKFREIIGFRQSKDYERESAKAERTDSREAAEYKNAPLMTQEFGQIVTQTVNNWTLNPKVKAFMDKAASGIPLTTEEHNALLEGVRQMELQIDTKINAASLRDGDQSYVATVPTGKVEEAKKAAKGYLDAIKISVGAKDYSTMGRIVAANQNLENAATHRMLTQFPILKDLGAISKINPNLLPWILAQVANKEGGMGGQIVDKAATAGATFLLQDTAINPNPPPMKNEIPKINSQLPTQRERSAASFSNTKNVLQMATDQKVWEADPQAAKNAFVKLFGSENKGFLPKVFAQDSWPMVFNQLTNPAMTARAIEIGKANPVLFQHYGEWSVDTARQVVASQSSYLRESLRAETRFSIEWDETGNRLVYKEDKKVPVSYSAGVRQRIDNINGVLRNLVPIIQAGGRGSVEETLLDVLSSAGFTPKKPEAVNPDAPKAPPPTTMNFAPEAPETGVQAFLASPDGRVAVKPPISPPSLREELGAHQTRGIIKGNLSDEDLLGIGVEYASLLPSDPLNPNKNAPTSGGPSGKSGGSISNKPTFEPPQAIQDALTEYARGKMSAKEIQNLVKQKGWSIDMRKGKYDFELFDPSGKPHYVNP